jgi:hypothetical protein
MFFVRQGATHKIVLGPVVAVANGYVPVTTLALTTADEAEAILHDNGTVVDISGYTWAAITTADGYYHLTLQSGISNTVGHVTIVVNDDSLCLPVKAEYTVLEEAVYDALFAASAAGYQVPIWAAAGSTVNLSATTIKTATDVETDTADIQARIPAALTADGNIKADTLRVGGTLQTAGDIPAMITTVDDFVDTEIAAMPASVWAYVVEGSFTAVQFLRGIMASVTAKLSGAATTTVTIRDASDTKNRVVVTVDADGNRSAVTYDLT